MHIQPRISPWTSLRGSFRKTRHGLGSFCQMVHRRLASVGFSSFCSKTFHRRDAWVRSAKMTHRRVAWAGFGSFCQKPFAVGTLGFVLPKWLIVGWLRLGFSSFCQKRDDDAVSVELGSVLPAGKSRSGSFCQTAYRVLPNVSVAQPHMFPVCSSGYGRELQAGIPQSPAPEGGFARQFVRRSDA